MEVGGHKKGLWMSAKGSYVSTASVYSFCFLLLFSVKRCFGAHTHIFWCEKHDDKWCNVKSMMTCQRERGS